MPFDHINTSAPWQAADNGSSNLQRSTPRPEYVLFGRGKSHRKHPGNILFRSKKNERSVCSPSQPISHLLVELVAENAVRYGEAQSPGDKQSYVAMIFDTLQAGGRGGFRQYDEQTDSYEPVDHETCRQKIMHAIQYRLRQMGLNSASNKFVIKETASPQVGIQSRRSESDCTTTTSPSILSKLPDASSPLLYPGDQDPMDIDDEIEAEADMNGLLVSSYQQEMALLEPIPLSLATSHPEGPFVLTPGQQETALLLEPIPFSSKVNNQGGCMAFTPDPQEIAAVLEPIPISPEESTANPGDDVVLTPEQTSWWEPLPLTGAAYMLPVVMEENHHHHHQATTFYDRGGQMMSSAPYRRPTPRRDVLASYDAGTHEEGNRRRRPTDHIATTYDWKSHQQQWSATTQRPFLASPTNGICTMTGCCLCWSERRSHAFL